MIIIIMQGPAQDQSDYRASCPQAYQYGAAALGLDFEQGYQESLWILERKNYCPTCQWMSI